MKLCRYSVQKRKDNRIYLYCKKNRCEVVSACYTECPFFERKGYKPINKVSKKRVTVSKETYNKVMERCGGRCSMCGTTRNLHYHHVLYRSERKDLIDEPDNGLMVCFSCHQKAHSNKIYWQPILLEVIENQKREVVNE